MMDIQEFFRRSKQQDPEDWQAKLKPGDKVFLNLEYGKRLTIYYEILDDPDIARGYKTARGYSRECPLGEAGCVLTSSLMGKIDDALWEMLRTAGWPTIVGAL